MKKTLSTLGLFLGLAVFAQAQTAFTIGNLVIGRVGDGTSALVNSGGNITVLEVTSSGNLVQSIAVPSGAGGLQVSGTATSELALSRSANNQQLVVAGYVPPFTGSGSLSGRTAAQAPRGFVTIAANGTVSSTTTLTGSYSGDNIRSGVTSGTSAWFAGSDGTGSGVVYFDGGNQTQIQNLNTRVVDIHNGNLYVSTASGTSRGIYGWTGTPTTAGNATYLINTGASSEPFDFVFNDLNTIAYVTNGAVLNRFAFDGSAWNLTHTSGTIGAGLTGLAVDFGGGTDTIYTLNPTTLFGLSFNGTAFSSSSNLTSAGSNYAFRGLDFAPVPEPGTWALIGVGMAFVLWRTRRRRES